MKTLAQIINEREDFLDTISPEDTLTEDLQKYLENNEIELKEKLDNFGFFINQLENTIEIIKKTKKDNAERAALAIERTQRKIESLKETLNFYAKGEKLEGFHFKFHPYLSMKSSISEEIPIEDCYKTYSITKISYDDYQYLKELVAHCRSLETPFWNIDKIEALINNAKTDVLVSNLPEGHPALLAKLTPSVRIR